MREFKDEFYSEGFEIPFDVLNLPSQGVFYNNGRSTLTIRYMTAREENILTSPSLIENGKAMDMVLESVIMDKEVDINNLMAVDKNAVFIFLRSTAYGDKFQVSINCPLCGKSGETHFLLSDLNIKESSEAPNDDGFYEFELPRMNIGKNPVIIKFKPMTVEAEKNMIAELQVGNDKLKKVKKTVTAKYVSQFHSVNGNSDKDFIRKVAENMLVYDSNALQKYMESVEPGIDETVRLKCPHCTNEFEEQFSVGSEILKLPPSHRKNVNEEIFLLTYYGKSITRGDAYRMAVTDRRWTIERISEEIERKNKAEQRAADQAKRQSKTSR
jgi:sarcosine oxidase delta subunit